MFLFADEILRQKLSTEYIKWEKINSDKSSPKNKTIEWEYLSKEYENEAPGTHFSVECLQNKTLCFC